MRRLERIVEKRDALIDVIGNYFCSALIDNKEFLNNHEYKQNIGTLYKGSVKESNKMLRFKERFKMGYLATTVGTQTKYVEVI